MFTIGIRSGIITLLGLIAYSLVIEFTGLQNSILGHLQYVVLGLGIHSAQYYYKYANNGQITYVEGVKVGAITVLFTSLIISSLIYIIALQYGDTFIAAVSKELHNITAKNSSVSSLMQTNMDLYIQYLRIPSFLLLMVFTTFSLIGLVFTLFLAFFSKTNHN